MNVDTGVPQFCGLPPRRLLSAALAGTEGAYLSHGSALAWHGLGPPAPGIITASAARYGRNRLVGGASLRFIRCAEGVLFGVAMQVVPGGPGLLVSDPERSVVDALRRPDLCGGLAAVVGALWRGRARLAADLLTDYALRLPVASVGRRLGFLLEFLGIGGQDAVARLLPGRTATWTLLDPIRGQAGPRLRRWGLRLNVDPHDLALAAGVEQVNGVLQVPELGVITGPMALAEGPPPAAAPVQQPIEVGRPRRLAGLCRRYDLMRLVVLQGSWAEIAGHDRHDARGCLPVLDPERIRRLGAACDGPGEPDLLTILVESHTDRLLGPAARAAVERELAQILGRPVALRTMRELLHRVARLALHAGPVIYHRHDRGQ